MQGMTLVVLYQYVNCNVNKLLAMALFTDYITNYSIIIMIIIKIFDHELLACKLLKIDPFQGLI